MDSMQFRVAAVVLIALMTVLPAWSLEFEMQTQTKCIYEELNDGALVVGEYKLFYSQNPDHPMVAHHVMVIDPHGATLYREDSVQSGQFAFTSKLAGEYQACFIMGDNRAATETKIKLDWKTGVAATDWKNIAKKEHLDELSVSLRKLEENIREVYNEMLTLQQREQDMRDISESTNSRVAWYSMASLVLCVMSGIWQYWYLRRLFRRKKLC